MFSRNKSRPHPVIKDGDKTRQAKFEALVDSISSDLYRYANWVCNDTSMAQELVQETYMRAWKSLDKLREVDAAKSWLFTIFRREYARQFERIRPKTDAIEDHADLTARVTYDTRPEAFALRQALHRLTPEYREPFVLQVLGGFKCEEIADILGLSKSAVMTRVFRARKQLRDQLAKETSIASSTDKTVDHKIIK